jgi:hypothetical protein
MLPFAQVHLINSRFKEISVASLQYALHGQDYACEEVAHKQGRLKVHPR